MQRRIAGSLGQIFFWPLQTSQKCDLRSANAANDVIEGFKYDGVHEFSLPRLWEEIWIFDQKIQKTCGTKVIILAK